MCTHLHTIQTHTQEYIYTIQTHTEECAHTRTLYRLTHRNVYTLYRHRHTQRNVYTPIHYTDTDTHTQRNVYTPIHYTDNRFCLLGFCLFVLKKESFLFIIVSVHDGEGVMVYMGRSEDNFMKTVLSDLCVIRDQTQATRLA